MIYSPIAWLFSATWLALVSVRVRIGSNPEFSARERGMCSRASANARKEYCSIVLILSAAAPTAMEQAISEAPPEIWKKYFYRLVIWQKKMWVLKNKSEFILLSWYLYFFCKFFLSCFAKSHAFKKWVFLTYSPTEILPKKRTLW